MLTAVFADENGEIFDAPGWNAVGTQWLTPAVCKTAEMIPLPAGAELMYLPGRRAIGVKRNACSPLGRGKFAVAAILPVGHTRLLLPAFQKMDSAPVLPLFGYTAVAWGKGRFWVAAMRSDETDKWNPAHYNGPELSRLIARVKHDLPDNRLVEHLAHCSRQWHCCTAQNLFYRRWEAGIPASPLCNANCLGCISLQPAECCPSPQSRITFSPTSREIAAIALYHLEFAPEAIVSFGQGCEGDPALAAETIAPAIESVRRQTGRGLINMNTNAGCTEGIRQVADAGIDSLRVSLISAREETHRTYYRSSYSLANVRDSIVYAKRRGCHVSVNMLLFPGLNDQPDEIVAWQEFLRETGVDMIQLRNLNIDPDLLRPILPDISGTGLGTAVLVAKLQEAMPDLKFGSYSHFNKNR